MKLSVSLNRKGSHKLNEFIHIPVNSKPIIRQKKPHVTFHHQQSRLDTDVTDVPGNRQNSSASFYDGFEFVDRLTNNKLVYRDVRKGSNSLTQLRKVPFNRVDEKPQMNSLLQIYKKTKNFQMKSLKEKIFKKIESGKELPQKTPRNFQDSSELCERKTQKTVSLIYPKPTTASQFIERSRKKNRLKSFLDRTVGNMNKAELHRIVNQKGHVREEVIQFNTNLLNLKCTMDREKLDDLLYLREKQEWELGRPNAFVEKQKPIVFKEINNILGKEKKEEEVAEQMVCEKQAAKTFGKNKRKKVSLTEQKDNFLEKMLIHARNHLKKQGEFLVQPKKQNFNRNMLMKKSRKHFLHCSNTDQDNDLNRYSFQKKEQSSLVSQVKSLITRKSLQNSLAANRPSQDQKNIAFMIKHNYISNLGLELTCNPSCCYTKDQKGNNLLHMAVRYQRPEVIEMIFKKVPYRICRNLLTNQNCHKRTPLELAKLVVDVRAVQIIEKFIEDNRQRDIVEGWIDSKDSQSY